MDSLNTIQEFVNFINQLESSNVPLDSPISGNHTINLAMMI
jgi:hypothetical protein